SGDPFAQEQAQIGRDLVVARAPGVDALAEVAAARDELALDEAVHVLGLVVARHAVRTPVRLELGDRRVHPSQLGRREHAGPGERVAPRAVDLQIGECEHVVDGQALLERRERRVEAALEAAAPHLAACGHSPVPWTRAATAPGRPYSFTKP